MPKGSYLFTSESVTEGHPDKMCDQVSDAIVDAILAKEARLERIGYTDPDTGKKASVKDARIAVETMMTTGTVVVAGEVRTSVWVDIQQIVRETIRRIGYDRAKYGFDCDTCGVLNLIHEQSPDIAQGVDESYDAQAGKTTDPLDQQGAGDQGVMFGYACNETPTLMPMPIYLAHRLAIRLAQARKEEIVSYLRPDGKTQVTVRYEDDKPVEVTCIVVSTQHAAEITDMGVVRKDVLEHVIKPVLDEEGIKWDEAEILVNPTGRFEVGGPQGDTGLCLDEKTLIATKRGLIPIADVKIDDAVYTENGIARIIEKVDNGERITRTITDENGISITATPNHPFRVFDGEDIVWRECGALKPGDVILRKSTKMMRHFPKKIPSFSYSKKGKRVRISLNSDFMYLLGWLVGDGNTTTDDRITFYYGCEEDREGLRKALYKCFEEEDIKDYEYQDDRFMILSKDLVKQLRQLGVTMGKSYEKEIPRCVLEGNDQQKMAFIGGLFDTDGHISTDEGRDGQYITIILVTTSPKLAQQVGILLSSLGIHSTVEQRSMAQTHKKWNGRVIEGHHPAYAVRITGLKSIRKFLYGGTFRLSRRLSTYRKKELPTKFLTHDSNRFYIARLVRNLVKLDGRKEKLYFENYGSKASIRKDRAYKQENIEYLLDMYAEYASTPEYQAVRYIYDNFEMVKIDRITEGTAHTYDISLDDETHSFIANGFIVHNTGRKIVVDTYGGMGRHGGGAFSGKDASKVDRSATYAARWVAKNVVAAGLADKCEVEISYAIGVARPLSVLVDTHGTAVVDEKLIEDAVMQVFDLRPGAIIRDLDLLRPIYGKTAAYGHFGRKDADFTWEKTNKVDELRKAVGLAQ